MIKKSTLLFLSVALLVIKANSQESAFINSNITDSDFSKANSQDTTTYKLRLNLPVIEIPDNFDLPQKYPSMDQALKYSNDLYELGYWGIDELGNKLFSDPEGDKLTNFAFKYIVGLAFAKYGSELPIPLGVWGHEEYHRAVLGTSAIHSTPKNGNWLFSRWDGTVYGVSDEDLTLLKDLDINILLYSYVSGVQYETDLNRYITIQDFYNKRSHYKNALILYNAWYVYDYFRFSVSDESDSVKVIAPENESADPMERDFAGADLTAWVYDIFNSNEPYINRDSFPGGEGVNRRIGFSDLSQEAGDYLKKQRNLSFLNFINPAIFFINRIKVSEDFSFTFFTQYVPTHFGNDVALYFPFKFRENNLLINLHSYSNKEENTGWGIGVGAYKVKFSDKIEGDFTLNVWNRPEYFFNDEKQAGGYLGIESRYKVSDNLAISLGVDGKTSGWMPGEPVLKSNFSLQAGLNYQLKR